MRHGADKLSRRIARQLRIRIQRDDIFHVRQNFRLAGDKRETIRWPAAQKRIQVRKLPPLTFKTHPNSFLYVPSARTMKKEERVAFGSTVFFIELIDSLMRQAQQWLIFSKRLLMRVPKIR